MTMGESCLDRQFIDDPQQLVKEWNLAQTYLQPGLQLDEEFSVLYKRNLAHVNRVTVLSGGGSGHEPAHSGYIGEAMLDVAVCGALFASPNVTQIYRGLEHAASSKGTLVIVKNYTGDKLNFGLAVERYKSVTGNNVKIVFVADDVSVGRSRGKFVGRRGLAGTALIHKVAGGAAEKGLDLEVIVSLCNLVSKNLGTIGVSLGPCNVPGQKAMESTQRQKIQLGMGIHNESAISQLPANTTAHVIIENMLQILLNAENKEHGFLPADTGRNGNSVVLLINNLGGLSVIEIGALTSIVTNQLKTKYNITPCRTYAGSFLTALDGRGFSITLLNLNQSAGAATILSLLDAQTTANGWTASLGAGDWVLSSGPNCVPSESTESRVRRPTKDISCDETLFSRIVKSIVQECTAAEPTITRYDTICGDGDCGTTLLSGAQAMMNGLENGVIPASSISRGMQSLAEIVVNAMGGTSGAIYGIFLSAMAAAIAQDDEDSISFRMMVDAAQHAISTLMCFTGARVGDRTLMDALIPFMDELQASSQSKEGVAAVEAALQKAVKGCEGTRFLESRFGRSTYVNDEDSGQEENGGLPDPGACGIVAVLTGIVKGLS